MRLTSALRHLAAAPERARARAAGLDDPSLTAPEHGFTAVPRSRRRLTITHLLVYLFMGLACASFVLQTIVGPILRATGSDDPPPAVAATVDPAAAAQLAVAFTADYFSYDPTAPEVRATALARWGQDGSKWEGRSQLHADVVTAGASAPAGDGRLLVQTTARVTPAALTGDTPAPAGQPPIPAAADPGPARGPWTPQSPRWLTLDVAVTAEPTGLRVTGATLGGDQPTPVTAVRETDGALTADLAPFATDVFTALASGELGYITAPDVQLRGLGGAVQLDRVTAWSVGRDPADSTTRTATATATWQLAGTDLVIAQDYALQITQVDGRWLVGTISTQSED